MEKFIVAYDTLENGEKVKRFHEDIYAVDPKKGAMNKYGEVITSDKRKAKRFYDYGEAMRVGIFFAHHDFTSFHVLKVK